MANEIKIIDTGDGSKSLYHQELNETYHSTHGALTESKHVFIQHGLEHLRSEGKESLSILEIGLGTGLNALLSQAYAIEHPDIDLDYTTLEPYPIADKLVVQLDYYKFLQEHVNKRDFETIHQCPWEVKHELLSNFAFSKYKTRLQQFETNSKFDVIFYDAFAPSKQAEMWESELIEKTSRMLSAGGVLVTYCAKGQLKRDLATFGLTVETLAGPPGKKEMVRASKP